MAATPKATAPEKLRECIVESGLQTDAAVAEQIGCSPSALSGFLAGKLTPGYRIRCAIRRWTRGRIEIHEWDDEKDRAAVARVVLNKRIRRSDETREVR